MPSDTSTTTDRCDDIAVALAIEADGTALFSGDDLTHVEHCLRCQAELVQYRKLLRVLRTMRTEVLVPSPGLLADVLASLEEAGERHAIRLLLTGRKAVYLGGLAAATAAGAAGAIVLATRSRKGRLPLAG